MSFIEKNESTIPSVSEKIGIVLGFAGIGITYYTTPVIPEQFNYIGIVFIALLMVCVLLSVFQLRNTPEKERMKRILMMMVMDLCVISIILLSFRIIF